MKRNILIIFHILVVLFFAGCKKIPYEVKDNATCTDGRQNQGETGIDCGGPCAPCADAALMHTKKYYISFMFDSVPVVFESDSDYVYYNPLFPNCFQGNIATSSGFSVPNAQFALSLFSRDLEDILALDGDTIYFETYGNTANTAHLELDGLVGDYMSTTQVLGYGTIESNRLIIDDVAFDNVNQFGNTRLVLTGRFNAIVASGPGGVKHHITKGTFGIPFG